MRQSLKRASLRTHSKAQFYPLPPPFQSFYDFFCYIFPPLPQTAQRELFGVERQEKGFSTLVGKKSSKEDNCTIAAAIACLSAWASA